MNLCPVCGAYWDCEQHRAIPVMQDTVVITRVGAIFSKDAANPDVTYSFSMESSDVPAKLDIDYLEITIDPRKEPT